jgi:hypothetical protein
MQQFPAVTNSVRKHVMFSGVQRTAGCADSQRMLRYGLFKTTIGPATESASLFILTL